MQQEITSTAPVASNFVSSPLRNRIKLELNAPVSEVWTIVGDPARMPEYSSGLQKVETERNNMGNCNAYTCYFKPLDEGGQPTIHHSGMVWYLPQHGWASLDEEPNPFGLQESLTLITFDVNDNKTILTWDMHFNSENEEALKMNISSLGQALNDDIAQNLVKRFGGKVLETYVEGRN